MLYYKIETMTTKELLSKIALKPEINIPVTVAVIGSLFLARLQEMGVIPPIAFTTQTQEATNVSNMPIRFEGNLHTVDFQKGLVCVTDTLGVGHVVEKTTTFYVVNSPEYISGAQLQKSPDTKTLRYKVSPGSIFPLGRVVSFIDQVRFNEAGEKVVRVVIRNACDPDSSWGTIREWLVQDEDAEGIYLSIPGSNWSAKAIPNTNDSP